MLPFSFLYFKLLSVFSLLFWTEFKNEFLCGKIAFLKHSMPNVDFCGCAIVRPYIPSRCKLASPFFRNSWETTLFVCAKQLGQMIIVGICRVKKYHPLYWHCKITILLCKIQIFYKKKLQIRSFLIKTIRFFARIMLITYLNCFRGMPRAYTIIAFRGG